MSVNDTQEIDVNALMRGLVHELRNPLSAVLTASTLLQAGGELDEETLMLIDVVQKESRRMNRILVEFSAFVKPPAARPEFTDIARIARHILIDMQREGTIPAGVEFHDGLPETLPAHADPNHIRRAMVAIMENAVEELQAGGSVHLSSAAEHGHVQFIVEDSGSGLGSQELESAFHPFFSTKPQSTGLGLSVARAAARSSGGDLTIENADSGGARVVLSLPQAIPEPTEAEVENQTVLLSNGTSQS